MTRDDEPERDILKAIGAYRRPTITAGELHQALPKEQRYEWQEEVLAKIGNMWREGLSDANRQEPTMRSPVGYLIQRQLPAAGRHRLVELSAC